MCFIAALLFPMFSLCNLSQQEWDTADRNRKKNINTDSEFIYRLSHKINTDSESDSYYMGYDWTVKRDLDLRDLYNKVSTIELEPEPELISLIYKIFSLVISLHSKYGNFIRLCPQVRVTLEKGKCKVSEDAQWSDNEKWRCFPEKWVHIKIAGEDATYFGCLGCNSKNHGEFKQAPVEVKHHLHRKHSLQLVLLDEDNKTRRCYCCDDVVERVFYCCLLCNFGINMACLKKPPVLSIDSPKWHEHTLYLFPRYTSLTCNLCSLADANSPIYMCPNCDFVVHLRCITLPRVIKISRHHHRISFTPSFDQRDWSCGVCRRNIDNDYGGYSCIKNDCSYVAHSRCATQSNVWNGKELEKEAEEIEEVVEPFMRISDGIIQHCAHSHHYLRLDEDMDRDYDENKVCHVCSTPIYFGKFYSCMECDFILHEECANFPRKMYHPIHPYILNLQIYDVHDLYECEACSMRYPSWFYYGCHEAGCYFMLHVKCATIHEPLVHRSHKKHPLYLTSKPEDEGRICSVCNESRFVFEKETFNCIECDFALCFKCATLPQSVRYKHDRHMLTLSYGKKTSTMRYWCEVCEGILNPKYQFYVCDEYCCGTIHIDCLLGRDIYLKPAQRSTYLDCSVSILPNNHHMSRPFCSICEKRCPYKIIFKRDGSILCSSDCLIEFQSRRQYLFIRESSKSI